jgi:hypothetical protein
VSFSAAIARRGWHEVELKGRNRGPMKWSSRLDFLWRCSIHQSPIQRTLCQSRLIAGGMWRFLTTLSSRMTTMSVVSQRVSRYRTSISATDRLPDVVSATHKGEATHHRTWLTDHRQGTSRLASNGCSTHIDVCHRDCLTADARLCPSAFPRRVPRMRFGDNACLMFREMARHGTRTLECC